LKQAIDNLVTHKNGTALKRADRNFGLSIDERNELEKESILLQKAWHKFFADNQANMTEDNLAELLNSSRFQFFSFNNTLLNKDTEDIDDNSFVWQLAANAALDPNAFYSNYKDILSNEGDPNPIAPIPTQELAVYAAVAAISNGNVFKQFAKALKKSMSSYWTNLDEASRRDLA